MNRAKEFKAVLQQRFGGLQAIGAYLADLDTAETEEAFSANPMNYGEMFRATYRLANGEQMYDPGNCADYVLNVFEEGGQRYGFDVAANPNVGVDCYAFGHHAFALIRGRFVVDIWVSLYAERCEQVVFDLLDRTEHDLIKGLYGDPTCWRRWNPDEKAYQPWEELPEGLRPRLGSQLKLVDPLTP